MWVVGAVGCCRSSTCKGSVKMELLQFEIMDCQKYFGTRRPCSLISRNTMDINNFQCVFFIHGSLVVIYVIDLILAGSMYVLVKTMDVLSSQSSLLFHHLETKK